MLRLLALVTVILSAAPAFSAPVTSAQASSAQASSAAAFATDTLTGLWLTRDRDGVIRISPCDEGVCAEIAGVILDHPADPTPVDYRGVSQCHLKLITDARPIGPNLWKGHIVNPRSGGIYGVELHLDRYGNLALRGFLGIPLLGETQTWTRFEGQVPDDCRLSASANVAGTLPPVPERGQ